MKEFIFGMVIVFCMFGVLAVFARPICFVLDQFYKVEKAWHKHLLAMFFLLILFIAFNLLNRFYNLI